MMVEEKLELVTFRRQMSNQCGAWTEVSVMEQCEDQALFTVALNKDLFEKMLFFNETESETCSH